MEKIFKYTILCMCLTIANAKILCNDDMAVAIANEENVQAPIKAVQEGVQSHAEAVDAVEVAKDVIDNASKNKDDANKTAENDKNITEPIDNAEKSSESGDNAEKNTENNAENNAEKIKDENPVQVIELEKFYEMYNANINKINLNEALDDFILIDVRNTDEFYEDHIPGALNIPLSILSEAYIPELNKRIVVQCKSGSRGEKACAILQKRFPNKKDIFNLSGGISAWKASNYYVDKREGVDSMSIMRQTQVLSGCVIAICSGIASSISSVALIPCLMGIGMIYSGLTNSCFLGELLSQAPWNKKSN